MKSVIKFYGGERDIVVDRTRADNIAAAISQSTDGYIDIDGTMFAKKTIARIEPMGTEPDVFDQSQYVNDPARKLAAAKRCRGQYSISAEINRIARAEGANWPKLIADPKWRAMTRAQLLSLTDQWCDAKTGRCACEPEFHSRNPRHR